MNSEANRLATFCNWPAAAPVNPIRIAKAGFFYTGQGTEVECFSCGGKISQWNYGDQAMLRHQRMDPNCRFVVDPQLANNEPLDLERVLPQPASVVDNRDEEEPSALEPTPNEEDEMYRSDALRLLSFINWRDEQVSIASLVNAGFYHAGEGRLRCAWCGVELSPFRRLSALETPVDVHRRIYPRCEFIQTRFGSERAAHAPAVSQPQTPQVETPHNSNSMSEGATHNARLLSSGGVQGCQNLGVVPVTGRGVQHPTLASLAGRLATYSEWPAGRPQAPQALAEAGFFYTGQDDQVCCFYCDGGLGKWEAGDEPWAEHARWFPECGFVQLVKGAEFIAQRRHGPRPAHYTTQFQLSNERSTNPRLQNPRIHFPVSESQVEEHMEGNPAIVALGAGLDAARVRRAIRRRLQTTGVAYASSEALIDAVLNEQLNEESWGMAPNQRFARDILAEALTEFNSATNQSENSSRSRSPAESQPLSLTEVTEAAPAGTCQLDSAGDSSSVRETPESSDRRPLSLEEENRQLKEARLCKVCMDSEVSVVFLPCGHLVSCARCGAALSSCPLCRSDVRALVRAYLA